MNFLSIPVTNITNRHNAIMGEEVSKEELEYRRAKWSRIQEAMSEIPEEETVSTLRRWTGATQGSVSKWINLKNNISPTRTAMIAQMSQFRFEYLQTGNGPKVAGTRKPDEEELLKLYRQLYNISGPAADDILAHARILATTMGIDVQRSAKGA